MHGIKRRSSSFNTSRIDHIYKDPHENGSGLILHYGDLTDSTNILRIIQEIKPDEIYNLGAQSMWQLVLKHRVYCKLRCTWYTSYFRSVRMLNLEDKTKIYQASTSELFGNSKEIPQNENTPFYPRSPYAAAKLYAYWITVNYREAYGMFACNGILFNHESPRRGETFVTRKITRGLCRINQGLDDCLYMGNLDSLRDWGHAYDYVEMHWMMLQQEKPEDYVIATGRQESVRNFINIAAKELGWGEIYWEGKGINEVGKKSNGEIIIKIDKRYFRPTEVSSLLGDATKAKKKLGWEPKITLEELIADMIKVDKEEANKESILKNKGFKIFNSAE